MIRIALSFLFLSAAPALAHSEPFFHLHEISGWHIAGAVALIVLVSASIKAFRS